MTTTSALEASEGGPAPTALLATTLKVYEVPPVRSERLQLRLVPSLLQLLPPGVAVAVYEMIIDPPSLDGGAHEIVTRPPLSTPLTAVGAPGRTGAILGESACAPSVPATKVVEKKHSTSVTALNSLDVMEYPCAICSTYCLKEKMDQRYDQLGPPAKTRECVEWRGEIPVESPAT